MTDFRARFIGSSLYAWAQQVKRTCRYQIEGLAHLQAAKETEKPLIISAWHGMTMMLIGFPSHRFDFSTSVLPIPDDWRGDVLQVFGGKLGATPFPMHLEETASVATARRLVTLVRKIKAGTHCYINPDGPEGPAYVTKPGAAFIAQKAKGLILPVGAFTRYGYRVPRWDQYTLPYPFSRISVQIGAPMTVSPEMDLTAACEQITHALHRVTAQAAANYYERKP